MHDDAPLLRTIWESPYDDAPRLVYADWLEERGETERAELIRVQCELEALSRSNPRRSALMDRAGKLVRIAPRWLRRLPQCQDGEPFFRDVLRATFDRGFPYPAVSMTDVEFVILSVTIFGAAPLWRLRLQELDQSSPQFLDTPYLQQVRELWLPAVELEDQSLIVMLRSKSLGHLTAIDLRHNNLSTRGALALASCPNLPRLKTVDVRWNPIDAEGIHILRERFGDGVLF
ncbi:MAG: TIGR02996 domain-containing protein [Gemmataceae bacterium]